MKPKEKVSQSHTEPCPRSSGPVGVSVSICQDRWSAGHFTTAAAEVIASTCEGPRFETKSPIGTQTFSTWIKRKGARTARIRKHREKYQVLYRDPATRRERSAGVYARKADAARKQREIEHQLDTGTWIDPSLGRTPISDWSLEWLGSRSHLKPKTMEGYESLLRSRILPEFGSRSLQEIRPIDIEVWVRRMSEDGLSPSRIGQAVSVLSQVMDAAVRNMMIARNPAAMVRKPRKIAREMQFLNASQVGNLAGAVPDRYVALIYTLAYGGIRAGEAVALRRRRINLLRNEFVVAESATEVHGQLVFGETKNRITRTITIPRFLREMYEDHLTLYADPAGESLVFTSTDGEPLRLSNFRNRVWRSALREAQLPENLRIHDLRHTAASLLISQGVHPRFVQEHLGHSSIAITMDRYGHLYPEDRIRVAEVLESVYTNAAG